MVLSTLSLLITGVVLLIVAGALLAPLESLGWWAGWYGDKEAPPVPGRATALAADVPESPAHSALVYLSGIGAIDGESIPQEEIDWGRMAIRRLPGVLVVPDIYPYSVTNAGLTGDRAFARMYAWMERRRLKNPYDALQFVINLRNMFQVAVSADRRYGPIYNLGVASEIVKALQQRGYRVGSGKPVTLVGFSGGGQVALGAATYLQPKLGAPIRIISIGGVMSDDPGLDHIVKLYHLYGENDPVQSLGAKLYAGRWPWFPASPWNRAAAAGKIAQISMGPMGHNGARNYFGWTAFTPEGVSHAVATMDALGDLLARDGLIDPAALRAARAASDPDARAYEQARVAESEAARQARLARRTKKTDAA
jgi:hypothetical protein